MPNTINFNTEQLNNLLSLQKERDYPAAYRFMRDIARDNLAEMPTGSARKDLNVLQNWLDVAASVNSDDKSFSSELVRGSTQYFALLEGKHIDEATFQRASDKLAKLVIADALIRGGLPTAKEVIDNDVSTVVNDLGLPREAWAGVLADRFPMPIGLDTDAVSLPTDSLIDFGGAFVKAS